MKIRILSLLVTYKYHLYCIDDTKLLTLVYLITLMIYLLPNYIHILTNYIQNKNAYNL